MSILSQAEKRILHYKELMRAIPVKEIEAFMLSKKDNPDFVNFSLINYGKNQYIIYRYDKLKNTIYFVFTNSKALFFRMDKDLITNEVQEEIIKTLNEEPRNTYNLEEFFLYNITKRKDKFNFKLQSHLINGYFSFKAAKHKRVIFSTRRKQYFYIMKFEEKFILENDNFSIKNVKKNIKTLEKFEPRTGKRVVVDFKAFFKEVKRLKHPIYYPVLSVLFDNKSHADNIICYRNNEIPEFLEEHDIKRPMVYFKTKESENLKSLLDLNYEH